MAINTIKATIQMRHGNEIDFDPDRMTAGEWAVSMDSKKVWMCFRPGFVLRMATYEAFEQDMDEIRTILATCQDIRNAVQRFMQLAEQHKGQAEIYAAQSKSWAVGATGNRAGEDTDNAKYYSSQSSGYAVMSKSWATGSTHTREGEDTDNSKYYSGESKKHSEISKIYLEKVEKAGDEAVEKINEAVNTNVPDFFVDILTGNLMYEGGRFCFEVQNGSLMWGIMV